MLLRYFFLILLDVVFLLSGICIVLTTIYTLLNKEEVVSIELDITCNVFIIRNWLSYLPRVIKCVAMVLHMHDSLVHTVI